MRYLFLHQNFPGQFRHIAPALAERGHEVVALGAGTAQPVTGVRVLKYRFDPPDVSHTHLFARTFDIHCRRAELVMHGLAQLKAEGFTPDIIVGHPGWGEHLPVRVVYPDAKIIAYCEFYYARGGGIELDFDPEFSKAGLPERIAFNAKNASNLLALADADEAIAPTEWQKRTFPSGFHSKIKVIHEGVRTDIAAPSADAWVQIGESLRLAVTDEVITFVARNLEPTRGFHIFMRALPEILRKRPKAQVLIVGGDQLSYGLPAPDGKSWKDHCLAEVKDGLDMSRVHFLGVLSHANYLNVLRISSVHVYLTYPFVLSWSLLEAMSTGCLVVGSETEPVKEVIDATNGLLVPFFDVDRLSKTVIDTLKNRNKLKKLKTKARADIIARFDLHKTCLPLALKRLGA